MACEDPSARKMASESYRNPTRVGFEAVRSRSLTPLARTSSTDCVNRFCVRRQFVRSENMLGFYANPARRSVLILCHSDPERSRRRGICCLVGWHRHKSAATDRTQKTKASRMGRLIHKNQTSFLPTQKILYRQLTHVGGNFLLKSRPIPNPHARTNQSLAFRPQQLPQCLHAIK